MSYLEDYVAHTDNRIQIDPVRGIGGRWNEIGNLQMEFLLQMGLTKNSHLLDFGCGTGRLATKVVRHCKTYTGVDVSPEALKACNINMKAAGWGIGQWQLYEEISPQKFGPFDFIMAHSVFTHLPPKLIETTLVELREIMRAHTRMYFTYHPGEAFHQRNETNFEYSFETILLLAPDGLQLRPIKYEHPRGQKMVEATLCES